MKARFKSQANTEFSDARINPGIAAIQVCVPPQTRVHNPRQNPSEGGADREAATAKRHLERVLHVLVVALGVAPDVEPLAVVVPC